jgi:hypothetical protein
VRPILHLKLFHPLNDHYGMSPIEAAATAIDIHNTAAGWNKALLDNSARPSGALVYAASNGQMTDDQFTRLKSELETNFQGARAAGRPLLLEGGLDWKPLSLSPKDMDFIEAKNAAAREIALAIGVPPMLLGIPGDNTYSNYQEAQRAFWRQTVLPLVNRTARALVNWLAPGFETSPALGGRLRAAESPSANVRLELRPDLDQIEALAPERDALWKRLEAASFLTTDEKRAAAGYASLSDAPGDSPSSIPAFAGRPPGAKYAPEQPRVPAGQSGGGQWTDGDRLAMAKIIQGASRYLLRNPKVLKPAEKTLEDLLKPGGKELGIRKPGADEGIRTLQRSDFQKLKSDLLDGAQEVPAPSRYDGKWYQRPDGSVVGVRESAEHGETLEVIRSLDRSVLDNGYKVHFDGK